MADLLEHPLLEALGCGIVGVGKENGAEPDTAANRFLQRTHTLNGEASIVSNVPVGVDGAEILQ
jgi:hypothetical protein